MDNRKIIVSCYLALSATVWFLSRAFLHWLGLISYQFRKVPGLDMVREVGPVVLALVTFALLWKSAKINQTLEEVVNELKKVSFPKFEDVKKSTIVVMVCILLASGMLAIFDLFFGKVVGWLLSSNWLA